ncbi:MAG: ribonuclease P protein component [Wolbachia sp.]
MNYAHSKYKKKEFSFTFENRLAPGRLFYRGLYISLYAIKEREPEKYINIIRVGLAISKKVRKAAKRNKIKRQLRMLIKISILNISNVGYYYIILTHKNIMQAGYKNLQKDLTICLKKIK